MYCKKCGKQIADGSQFCPYCGATQGDTAKSTKGKVPVKTIGIAVMALVAVAAVFFFLNSKKISYDDLMTTEIYGYNGYGELYSYFKSDGKVLKRYDEVSEKYNTGCVYPDESTQCRKWYDEVMAIDSILESVECSATKESYLSNGEKVHIGCQIDEESVNKAGYSLGKMSKDITISGLEEPKEIDLFDGVRFEWAYQDGAYVLNQITTEPRLEALTYRVGGIDQNGNADVYIDEDDETLKNWYGIIPKDGVKSKNMYVGKAPELVTYPANSEEEKVILEKADKKMEQLCNKCGWEVYKTSTVKYLIKSYSFNRFSNTWYGVTVVYDVQTENGNYTKEVTLPALYRMPDGSLVDHEEFDPAEYGCSISGSYWTY